jgi:hypothetical protein
MSETIYVERSDATIDRICRLMGYDGRKVKIRVTDKVRLAGTYWEGGSKSDYTAFDLNTLTSREMPAFNPPQFGGPTQTPEVTLFDGLAIVEHSMFCGKDTGLTVYINPSNAAPLLPKAVDLTPDEKKVLDCTSTYKSSYGGIKDYRFSQSGMTRERWDTAKVSCQTKGLLDKRGAITVEGRNALNQAKGR